MKEIDEKGVIGKLMQEREDMYKQVTKLQIQADAINEQIGRLRFELTKKQGAIDEFEKLFLVIEQKSTEKSLGKDDKVQ